MEINFYTINYIINTVSSIVFGVFIYFRGGRSKVGLYWLRMCLFVSLWAVGMGILFSCVNASYHSFALFGSRFGNAFAMFIPPLFLRFVVAFLDIEKDQNRIVQVAFLSTFPLLFLIYTPAFLAGVRPISGLHFYTKAGPLLWFYFIHFIFWVIYSHWLMIKYFKELSLPRKKQVRLLFIATAIGFSAGVITFLPCFDIPISPWLSNFTWVYVAIMFYAVLRYQLLDVQVILRKAVVFALLFMLIAGTFALSAFVIQSYIEQFFSLDSRLLYGVTIFIIVLAFQPLQGVLTKLTQRFLFQKKYDHSSILRDFSKSIASVLSREEIISKIKEVISNSIYVDKVQIINSKSDSISRPISPILN
jgi:hypothetical protein